MGASWLGLTYPHLPTVGSIAAPPLPFLRSPNQSSRNGRRARLVFVHRWGGGTFEGTCEWLCKGDTKPGANDGSQASAHVVYAGQTGPDAGKAVQLVPWSQKAWTEYELNPVGLSIESADAIWLGHDPEGFAQLARLVALLCHIHLDACRYVTAQGILSGAHGFTRHSDGGAAGGGHPYCPTSDLALWGQFAGRVIAEWRHGGFRDIYGRT